jgi:hypothetical protein
MRKEPMVLLERVSVKFSRSKLSAPILSKAMEVKSVL